MGETTHISWADATFNPWIGCTKVSPACDGCYAEHMMATRMGRVTWGAPGQGNGTRERTSVANWRKPVAWDKTAAKAGARPFVFCSSLADVFDNEVPAEWRRDLFDLIRATPNLTWLLLTKRPGNIVTLFDRAHFHPEGEADWSWPRNAAIGCTVVTQEEANRDVPKLLAAKAALNPAFAFVSMEPLLGPVDLTSLPWRFNGMTDAPVKRLNALTGAILVVDAIFSHFDAMPAGKLDWVITGGETDQGAHKARPSNPAWFRSLRDQCAAAGVAYHHKQNGEWADYRGLEATGWDFTCERRGARFGQLSCGDFGDAELMFSGREFETLYPWPETNANPCMVKAGKKAAGRALDGVIHDARPVLP